MYLLTATVIVIAREFAKRNNKLGAMVVAIPMVTILTLIWLYIKKQAADKIASHAWYTFWYDVPTLFMFLIFPWLLQRVEVWFSLLISAGITILCFWLYALLMGQFGINS